MTSPYWFTLDELNTLANIVVETIDNSLTESKEHRMLLHGVQAELAVAKTRDENAILPSGHVATALGLPSTATIVRLKDDEVALLNTLTLPPEIKGRLQ